MTHIKPISPITSPSRPSSETFHPALRFSDSCYLSEVVRRLRRERRKQGLSVSQVARKAGVRRSLIDHAELDGYIPCSRDFKAWTAALGMDWEEIWTVSCPGLLREAV